MTSCSEDRVVTRAAYVLFYRRRENFALEYSIPKQVPSSSETVADDIEGDKMELSDIEQADDDDDSIDVVINNENNLDGSFDSAFEVTGKGIQDDIISVSGTDSGISMTEYSQTASEASAGGVVTIAIDSDNYANSGKWSAAADDDITSSGGGAVAGATSAGTGVARRKKCDLNASGIGAELETDMDSVD